jgi:hypothetical protein
MNGKPTVTLTLVPAAGFRGDPYVRLRRLMKAALRRYGWRATAAELPPAAANEGKVGHEEEAKR